VNKRLSVPLIGLCIIVVAVALELLYLYINKSAKPLNDVYDVLMEHRESIDKQLSIHASGIVANVVLIPRNFTKTAVLWVEYDSETNQSNQSLIISNTVVTILTELFPGKHIYYLPYLYDNEKKIVATNLYYGVQHKGMRYRR